MRLLPTAWLILINSRLSGFVQRLLRVLLARHEQGVFEEGRSFFDAECEFPREERGLKQMARPLSGFAEVLKGHSLDEVVAVSGRERKLVSALIN